MSIQFRCAACQQPIEVDDDAANQVVTCPYCRKVVTAPPQSDTNVLVAAPQARTSDPYSPMPMSPQVRMGTNIASWLALALMVLSAVFFVIASISIAPIMKDMDTKLPIEEQQKIMSEKLQGAPAIIVMAFLSVCIFPVAGVICSIAGLVSKKQPKWPAIVSLVLLLGVILLVCLGAMMQTSLRAGQGT